MKRAGCDSDCKQANEESQPQEQNPKRRRLEEVVVQYRVRDDMSLGMCRNALPDGWVEIPHYSGWSVYLHKATRVCSCTRPYHVPQESSVRSYLMPLCAIPCLERKRRLSTKCEALTDRQGEEPVTLENKEIREYLNCLWEFDVREIPCRQQSSKGSGQVTDSKVALDVCLSHRSEGPKADGKATKMPIVKTAGRPPQAILHDYCERVLKTMYEWTFSQGEGFYQAEVYIGEGESRQRSGKGVGKTKKEAKKRAAEEALSVVMPHFVPTLEQADKMKELEGLKVDDVRVVEKSSAAGIDSPYMLLCEFVRRNELFLPLEITFNVTQCQSGVKYVMSCGQHRVEGTSLNKQTAKNIAAQKILKLFHPTLSSWADLLQLYNKDTNNLDSLHDKEVKLLAESTVSSQLNRQLLSKLRDEMKKLGERTGAD